jgi:hypothetical protein
MPQNLAARRTLRASIPWRQASAISGHEIARKHKNAFYTDNHQPCMFLASKQFVSPDMALVDEALEEVVPCFMRKLQVAALLQVCSFGSSNFGLRSTMQLDD